MIILLLDMVSMTLYKSIIVVVSGLILKAILILHVKLLKINLLSLKVIFFKDPEYNKGFVYPVVKKALKEYFLYGVDITEFIRNYINTSRTAIYDYCFSQKVAGKYTTIYKTVRDW